MPDESATSDLVAAFRRSYATVATWTDGLIERSTLDTDIDEARAAAERLAEERA